MKIKYYTKLIIIFILFAVIYGIFVSQFTSPVHIDVDEELYMSLAKSFHYEGKFIKGGEIMNYNCILYSLVISLAYYFYSPEHIMLIIRIMGVLMMCSAAIPIGLLANKVLKDDKKAILVTILIMMMPYMFDVAYAMQEVLSYPIFCWFCYVLYLFREDIADKTAKKDLLVCMATLSVMLVYTKTYLFFVPIILNLIILKGFVTKKYHPSEIKNIALYDFVYALEFFGVYFGIYAINGFEKGVNHYSSQIKCLFPITFNTIWCGLTCCIFYIAFFVVCTGFVPFVNVCRSNKKVNDPDKIISDFHIYGIFWLIVEIVFMIILTEMGTYPLPGKFLFRYFQIFVPGIMILAFREFDKGWNAKWTIIAGETALFVALIYFVLENGLSHNAITDGHIFLLIENITEYVIPHFNIIITVVFMILIPIVVYIINKSEHKGKVTACFITIAVSVLFIIQCIQLPYYTNVIAKGKVIEKDGIKIAHYIDDNDIDKIYYVEDEGNNPYLRNFCGFLNKDFFVWKDKNQIESYESSEKSVVIMADNTISYSDKVKLIDLGTESLFLYQFP